MYHLFFSYPCREDIKLIAVYSALLMLVIGTVEARELDEYPTKGLLFNTREDGAMAYDCIKIDEKLQCNFIQTSVIKKAKAADLDTWLAYAKKEVPLKLQSAMFNPKSCKITQVLIDTMKGSLSPGEAIKRYPDIAKDVDLNKIIRGAKEATSNTDNADVIAELEDINAICKNKSEENVLNITRHAHAKQMRTCLISSNNQFTQTFTWIADLAGKGAWVIENDTPRGACGYFNTARFESNDSIGVGNNKLILWKYVHKRIITNPSGEMFPGMKCGDSDQTEYVYNWSQKRNSRMGCEYVEFSSY